MPYYHCPACGLTSYSAAAYSTASACPNCSAALGEDRKRRFTPGADRRITRVLGGRSEAVAEARREVVGLALPETTRTTLTLLVSELVTNSVLHGHASPDSPIGLTIGVHRGRVRLAVHDGGRGFDPSSLGAGGPLTVGGQGLVIVDALSDSWGVDGDSGGCTVWCELIVEQEPATLDEPVNDPYIQAQAAQ